MVFCTEFLDGWWSWEPLCRSCVRCGCCRATAAPSAPYTRPTQRLSRPPPIQNLGAENHMLQLNTQCSWWWTYVPETCRAKNTSIKLPSCIKLAFHFISWGRSMVEQPSYFLLVYRRLCHKTLLPNFVSINSLNAVTQFRHTKTLGFLNCQTTLAYIHSSWTQFPFVNLE